MFEIRPSVIQGCYEIQPRVFNDERGRFVKIFHSDEFERNNFATNFVEEYYSVSNRGVLRGLHFQVPPKEHKKVVYCVQGEVFDVVLDLRQGSPTYGMAEAFTLGADKGNYVYIAEGLAHGFCAVSDTAVLVYKVTSTYSPQHDSGVLWSSVDVDWPVKNPLVSTRDTLFPGLSEFVSPFIYPSCT
ncbi:dTDP-4-dehydrorhamnose 3,5-epimerase [Pseudomonas sp. 8AS]|uniref:dTDP-4-dehydrorhamnose 3,5-epimerase n=1 Tax=Pseudomonas sp. 8AS TaxID=2653163 RepID=UPI00135ABEE8|nr:dTDP-4-dehydrorhamnose 3,5-epimerase [Pseudomonas sp. 8AS]